jgi:aldehyde:ferredoxin oxidoreductase
MPPAAGWCGGTERAYVLKGYQGKILRVDLARKSFREEPLEQSDLVRFLGGRGLAALYYSREIGPSVDALGPDNRLIFMTGPLTATPLFAVSKFQLATRSPETRMYLCSNCGGDFGPRLKQAGWDGLIIEGQAPAWTWLAIAAGAD